MFNKLFLKFVILAMICLPATSFPQSWDDVAYNFKSSSNKYDVHGFDGVDGGLSVNKSNGNALYSYPISNFSINGSNINVSLIYSGGVNFTSHVYYTENIWKKFSLKQPAWIMGVNGFAVQVLGGSGFFANKTSLLDFSDDAGSYYTSDWFTQETIYRSETGGMVSIADTDLNGYAFTNKDLNWSIEGYDYCNAMYDAHRYRCQDVIKILRADGGLLELRNANFSMDDAEHPEEITGRYYEQGLNTKGYAIVEYDSEAGDCSSELLDYGSNSNIQKKPRIVKYFPGDGMMYVFKEYITPYGPEMYNNTDIICALGYGWGYGGYRGVNAHPSIFYLSEIWNSNRLVTSFYYDRQHPYQQPFCTDRTVGRAKVRHFLKHWITYDESSISINAMDKTIKIDLGTNDIEQYQGFDTYKYLTVHGGDRDNWEIKNLSNHIIRPKMNSTFDWTDEINQLEFINSTF